jgi:plasmid replication initiation protein
MKAKVKKSKKRDVNLGELQMEVLKAMDALSETAEWRRMKKACDRMIVSYGLRRRDPKRGK